MGMPDASPACLQACLADFGLAHSDVNPNPTTAAPAAPAAAAPLAVQLAEQSSCLCNPDVKKTWKYAA